MHKCDGRMHFSEALMHDEIEPLRGCERDPMAQFEGIIINVSKHRKVHSDEKLYVLNFT